MDGFRVDLAALEQASRGVDGVLARVAQRSVEGLDVPPETVGHPRLAAATTAFCDRWAVGVRSLADEAAGISVRLGRCVAAYRAVDGGLHDRLVAGSGPDPGPA